MTQLERLARVEASIESIKGDISEIKDSLKSLGGNERQSSGMWQKAVMGYLVVQNLMHGQVTPEAVRDLLGMITGKGHQG